ncbi:hypothetical protein D3C72_1941050 [compost metagenome]
MVASKLASPDSRSVGTFGSAASRSRDITASARSAPDWICGAELVSWSTTMSIWPPMRSISAGAEPL